MVHGKFTRTPMMQDISWFIERDQNKKLNLNPSYQRRSVWTRKDRIFFLDTIFNGYPCPAIYLHKTMDDKGEVTHHVIDGKQRLETILRFVKNKIRLPKDFDRKNIDLAGKSWKDIPIEFKRLFWNYIIPVDQFDVIEEINIDEMFDRLNRNSRKLEPQELRHAKYDGWFAELSEKLASDYDRLKELKIVTTARARRMKDTQFVSELLMILISDNINGFSQEMIDNYYAYYDEANQSVEDLDNLDDMNLEDYEEDEFKDLRKDIDYELIEFDFKKVINYIYDMDLENSCVSNHSRSFTHFYTLFAFVALTDYDKLGDSKKLAYKYAEFMEKVSSYISNPKNGEEKETVIKYSIASSGASTDLPRRTSRYKTLSAYVLRN